MLLFGDFELLPLNLRLSSWGLVRRFSDGLPEERESWFAWVHQDVMSAMLGDEQKELRMLAVFPDWRFCMRRSVMAQTEFPDSAGPIFEFLSATPQELTFKDRKLVAPAPAAEPAPGPPAPAIAPASAGETVSQEKAPEGSWKWVEPQTKTATGDTKASPMAPKTSALASQSKDSEASAAPAASDSAPAEQLS